jgi:hypothetical protein
MTMGRAEAVGTGIATTNDHHALALGVEGMILKITLLDAVGQRQELHCLVNAFKAPTGDVEITPSRSTGGKHDRVKLGSQFVCRYIDTDVHIASEFGALGSHLVETLIEMAFLHLEFGNPITKKSAGTICPLKYDNRMPGARELLRGGETGWP